MSNYTIGSEFEKIFKKLAQMYGICVINIPQNQYMRHTKAPFDYILAFMGKNVFVDTKSHQGHALNYSKITTHQKESLLSLERHGCRSGYVVWYRDINKVVFYTAGQLNKVCGNESLSPEQGYDLGTMETMNLRKLFNARWTSDGLQD